MSATFTSHRIVAPVHAEPLCDWVARNLSEPRCSLALHCIFMRRGVGSKAVLSMEECYDIRSTTRYATFMRRCSR